MSIPFPGSMKDLTSQEDLIKSYTEKAENATKAAEEFRSRTLFEMANKIEEIKKARKNKDDEQRKAMEEEVICYYFPYFHTLYLNITWGYAYCG